ncbi:MAG: hypothetical protein GY913_26710 [Proteobacteria bacterium]|nr:hypothetical protein [Pseudomonadota bacterium]MCP4920508.1 hypothetical protein [Pseudomonadota bacterium]
MVENAVAFAGTVRARSCGPILLAHCAGAHESGARRVVAYSRVRLGLKLLVDAWLPADDVDKLPRLLLGAVVGQADAKPRENVSWVWLHERTALHLWRGTAPRVTVRAGGVEVRSERGQKLIQTGWIQGLQVEVSEIWDECEVLLNTSDGTVTLASKKDRSVLSDPDYDEEDVETDIAWATEFAERAADLLGVMYMEPDLD